MLLSASPFMPDLASAPESPSALYRSRHPAEPVPYTAQVTAESLKSAWRGRPVNGNQESRLLLDPIERHPVLLPSLRVGSITIARIPQVNSILQRRNTYTRAPPANRPVWPALSLRGPGARHQHRAASFPHFRHGKGLGTIPGRTPPVVDRAGSTMLAGRYWYETPSRARPLHGSRPASRPRHE
ncbi:hypothetical protein PS870_02408 [Pseudomonas fluorescens]|uniref:Uncharacterized protein n=1 Tax=Pseudomonas fluorescens TaxID=294 RepID=A0A5E7JYT0_PSEFL|nr:hypothetical protein PS870_02408 [Pseudomonas fluorescens]